MDVGLVVGLLGGLLGVAFAVVVMLGIPLGWFNRLLRVRPKQGAFPAGKTELLRLILAENDERQPWQYTLTPADPHADLLAEWKIADARWWAFFGRSRFSKTYRAFVSLDERTSELRVNEETATVRWSGSAKGFVPHVGAESRYFRGVILLERSRERAYGIKTIVPPDVGQVYEYDFDPWRVKGPLLRLAIENGWSYCPVVMRSQLGRKAAVAA